MPGAAERGALAVVGLIRRWCVSAATPRGCRGHWGQAPSSRLILREVLIFGEIKLAKVKPVILWARDLLPGV
jgi:hypothetical protein